MAFKRRWQPSAAQRKEYAERMRSIEAERSRIVENDPYSIGCTGDVVKGDEIAFFNAGKSSERIEGTVISESYGADKQQHTFTIETAEGRMLIKGRNLYANGVQRKPWADEAERAKVREEKHERGDKAREARRQRKAGTTYDSLWGDAAR